MSGTTYSSAFGQFVFGLSPFGAPTPQVPVPTPTTLQYTIPAYPYQEYSDDSDIRAFFDQLNAAQQTILDQFNQLNLPVYTSGSITGPLLDWVAYGLYGFLRPTLPTGITRIIGPINTYGPNSLALDVRRVIADQPGTLGGFIIGQSAIGIASIFGTSLAPSPYVATDDTFKRVITWAFYKGDGRVFSIRWLKRRIWRFLTGTNGSAPNIDQTYRVSVSFGVGNQVNIVFLTGRRTLTGGALCNRFALNTTALNALRSIRVSYPPLPQGIPAFIVAVQTGVLELPFQYDWVVAVS